MKSMKSMKLNNVYQNNTENNLAIFLIFALTVGYIANKHYEAVIFLYVIAFLAYLLCGKLFCALAISIILTNLLLSLNYFKVTENFKERGRGGMGMRSRGNRRLDRSRHDAQKKIARASEKR